MLKDFISNGFLFCASLFFLGQLYRKQSIKPQSPLLLRFSYGLLLGLLGLLLMVFSIHLTTTVIADMRHLAVVIAAMGAGPIGAVTAAAIIAVSRLTLFGFSNAALNASINILVIGVICGLLSRWKASRITLFTSMNLVALACVTFTLYINLQQPAPLAVYVSYWITTLLAAALTYTVGWQVLSTNRLYRRLAESESKYRLLVGKYRSVVDNVREVIFQTDAEGRWTFLNPSWADVTGFETASSLGQHYLDYVHPDDHDLNKQVFQALIEGKKEYVRYDVRYQTASGAYKWIEVYQNLTFDEADELVGTSGTLTDITERKLAQQKMEEANEMLRKLSNMDGLTGIANRRFFDEQLELEWKRDERNHMPLTLIMLDIDHFKLYNDTYGHQGGDECLKEFAAVLSSSLLRPGDFVARYGGEEFVIVLPETERNGGVTVAQRVQENLRQLARPHVASPVDEFVTCSIGIASMLPDSAHRPQELIEAADKALYHAKQAGRNRMQVGEAERLKGMETRA